ncbi:MAG TPA: hypothetical protein VKV16_09750, partial [Solirubrobacteraceae bacterium]|nr:hypothetical protein [Solirubrobacteraceae bacterium]
MPRSRRQLRQTLARAGTLLLAAWLVSACGSAHRARAPHADTASRRPVHNTRLVYIYSSLPARGPQAAASRQIEAGIEFALARAGRRIGRFHVRYERLSGQPVADAERAARNPQTVAFIGELDSGATALSLPITGQAGII